MRGVFDVEVETLMLQFLFTTEARRTQRRFFFLPIGRRRWAKIDCPQNEKKNLALSKDRPENNYLLGVIYAALRCSQANEKV